MIATRAELAMGKTLLKKIFVLAPLVAALSLYGTGAEAAPSVTNAFVIGQQQWSDDSAEIVIDNDGNGVISNGDYLVGVFGITSFPTSGVNPATVNQLTGIFAIQINGVPVSVPAAVCGPASITTCSSFTFSPVGAGFNAALTAADTLLGGGITISSYLSPLGNPLDANTVALFIEDGTTAFDRDGGTQANAFNTGGDGTVRLMVDLNGAPNSWTGTGPADTAEFLSVASGTGVGSFSINATIAEQNFPGFTFAPLITANGSIKPTSTSDFTVTDDTTFEVNIQRVPEPGTLLLLGASLVGVGWMRRPHKG